MPVPTNWNDMCFYRSQDAGSTWELVSLIPHSLGVFDGFAPVHPQEGQESGDPWAPLVEDYVGSTQTDAQYSTWADAFGPRQADFTSWFGQYPLFSWYRGDRYRAAALGFSGGYDYPQDGTHMNQFVWGTTDRGASWILLVNAAQFGNRAQHHLLRQQRFGTPVATGDNPNVPYWNIVTPHWLPDMPLYDYTMIGFDNDPTYAPYNYEVHFSTGPGGIICGPPTLRAGGLRVQPFGVMVG